MSQTDGTGVHLLEHQWHSECPNWKAMLLFLLKHTGQLASSTGNIGPSFARDKKIPLDIILFRIMAYVSPYMQDKLSLHRTSLC